MKCAIRYSEYDVVFVVFIPLVYLFLEQVVILFSVISSSLSFGHSHLLFEFLSLFFLCLLLFILHAFESVKVLSVKLVQLTLDPLDCVLNLRNNNEFQGIYSSVGNLDNSINGYELSLQRCNLNKKSKILLEPIFCLHNCLASSSHADH